MGAAVRIIERGRRLGERFLRESGAAFREARVALGVSQGHVAHAADISRTRYGQIEAGNVGTLSIPEFARIAVVLGLDPSVRLFPGGAPLRDSAQATRLRRLLEHVQQPLVARTEVPLPARDGRQELRAWDAVIDGAGERTAIELEMRLTDLQAWYRRVGLKRRDDPTEHFLLAVADTRSNRRVIAEFAPLLADMPRLRLSAVVATLRAGRHPPTGLVLV